MLQSPTNIAGVKNAPMSQNNQLNTKIFYTNGILIEAYCVNRLTQLIKETITIKYLIYRTLK